MRKTARNDDSVIVVNRVRMDRSDFVKSLTAERLYENAPGMSERKEVELFTKWRPHLPSWAQDITCPCPSDEVMARVKAEIVEKRQAREEKKKEKSAPSNNTKSTETKEKQTVKKRSTTAPKEKQTVKKRSTTAAKHKISKKSKTTKKKSIQKRNKVNDRKNKR